ncbi:phosphoglycerate mutase-like protein 1 isoform X2 [Hibiscus syriacus]|uniref:phosphoglycerate mutase-like protein 1 isoform X2 n=1 Tax=Hibiscus syriacus TaxID=106335 RepID=UPI0019228CF1|nr:phosphoglycerate mutase-like protein 1 isoform X2 [Hibiscus syriacus]
MDVTISPGLYPLHRCKTLHLARNAQGVHNVAGDIDFSNYLSEEFFDAHLTPLGWQQVDNLRKHVHETGLSKKIELVIVSPLLRTLQTAVGVFGGEGYKDGVDVHPLMVENAGKSIRPAISSLYCPPFVAVELCREHLGVHPCDRRKSISEYQPLFPAIDFSLIDCKEDSLWEANYREKDEEIATRGLKFLNWLWTREEREIAVVSHSSFLYQTLGVFGNDCHPSVKSEICTHMLGSDHSTINYPGKIPSGPDLPSDVAKKKLSNDGAGK